MDGQPNPSQRGARRRRPAAMAAAVTTVIPVTLALVPSATAATSATSPSGPPPPPLTFLTGTHTLGEGDIFVTPSGSSTRYGSGAEILSPT